VFLAIVLKLTFITAKKLLICDFIEIGFVDYVHLGFPFVKNW
jgi:hypothetical protein